MKTIFAAAILVLTVVSLAAAANAYTGVVLNMQGEYAVGAWSPVQMGWIGGMTTDSYDDGWDYAETIAPLASMAELDIVNSALGNGRWLDDFRTPLTSTNGPRIWLVKAYIPNMTDPITGQPVHFNAPFGIRAWFTPGYGLPTTGQLSDKVFAIFDGDVRATWAAKTPLWTSPHGVTGSFYSPNYRSGPAQFVIPDGGAHYFTVVTAPEPGSLLALLCGLVGLVGFRVRQRR